MEFLKLESGRFKANSNRKLFIRAAMAMPNRHNFVCLLTVSGFRLLLRDILTNRRDMWFAPSGNPPRSGYGANLNGPQTKLPGRCSKCTTTTM